MPARRRHVGAHAAPRRSPRVRQDVPPPPSRRPTALSGLLLAVIGGSLGVLAVLPPAGAATADSATAVTAASATPLEPSASAVAMPRDDVTRASRSRLRPAQELTALAAAPPVVVAPPPPPPPPPVLPGCDGQKADLDRYGNGRLPSSVLCTVPGSGEALRADAAVAFVELARAYKAHFGKAICLTDGYRTLGEQKALRRVKPRLAARPGTSEHGWGLAVDLACGVQSFRSPQHAWMVQNAETYGWYHPTWARRGGAKPEPWHWEYLDK